MGVRGRKRREEPINPSLDKRSTRHYYEHWQEITAKKRAFYEYCKTNHLCTRCKNPMDDAWTKAVCQSCHEKYYIYKKKEGVEPTIPLGETPVEEVVESEEVVQEDGDM